MPNGMPCKKMPLQALWDEKGNIIKKTREHFRPQANKSFQSRIFLSYLQFKSSAYKTALIVSE